MGNKEQKTEKIEKGHEDKSGQPEKLHTEAQAGMPGLVDDRQKLISYLKDGGKSGISTDFGKPKIEGLDEKDTHDKAIKVSASMTDVEAERKREASEKVEHKDKPVADSAKDRWEVEPHGETAVIQELIGRHAVIKEIAFPP